MSKRIREDRGVRISQIVDEAIRIVGELGYYGFTVQALAERCGISNAGLLYYFETKDALLLALLDEIERREEEFMAPLISVMEEQDGANSPQITAVSTVICTMAERLAANPEQGRFLIMLQAESMEPSHPAHQWFAQRDVETHALLVRLLEPLASSPLAMARYLMALVHGLGQQWLRSGQNFDLAAECEAAVCLLLANLGD